MKKIMVEIILIVVIGYGVLIIMEMDFEKATYMLVVLFYAEYITGKIFNSPPEATK